jgi:hypothetical protein
VTGGKGGGGGGGVTGGVADVEGVSPSCHVGEYGLLRVRHLL